MTFNGIIIRGIGGFYYVLADGSVYECKARGIFRKEQLLPMVGDKCVIDILDSEKLLANVKEIQPRTNQLIRPPVANIDKLAVVSAVASPEPDMLFIDKLFVIAAKNGIEPMLILNKVDLLQDEDAPERIAGVYRNAGFRVFITCAVAGIGLDEVRDALKGGICALAGASGVGKSSLLNVLLPQADMAVGDVSQRTQRGRHTTRHVELHYGEGLLLMDTPGFSSLEFDGIKAQELEGLFPEFEPHIGGCRFRGCMHVNEPDCAVKNAVRGGDIAESRHCSYVQFYNMLKDIKEWKV